MIDSNSWIVQAVQRQQDTLLERWVGEQFAADTFRRDLINEADVRAQSRDFLQHFSRAVERGSLDDVQAESWSDVRAFLERLSRQRAAQGFSFSEVATFVFSFKQPLFERVRAETTGEALTNALWTVTTLLDQLGLYTVEIYQRSRESIIERQRQEMLELSTPVVKVWDGVVALPLIGTLDSERTQIVMETLLTRIVETSATIAIIDITGVPTVDTLVAQHLLRTVAAAQLMGTECIISGIRPQIAQTIVHLGIDLSGVLTKASLADAIQIAMERSGFRVTRERAPV